MTDIRDDAPPPPLVSPAMRDVWHDARSQLEAEDGLVNNRIGWMLALNGFLFTAFGLLQVEVFSACAAVDAAGNNTPAPNCIENGQSHVSPLMLVISIAGVGAGWASYLGVLAAFNAILDVRKEFHKLVGDKAIGFYARPISSKWAADAGMRSALTFPILAMGLWLFLLFDQVLGVARMWSVLGAIVLCICFAAVASGLLFKARKLKDV